MELNDKQLLIETTNLCDAHCVICPRETFTRKLQSMDMDLFKKIIDDAVQYNLKTIDTCGYGECFLDKHLFERFAYIRARIPKAEIYVSTTAFHMDFDTWDDVIKYIDILKFSIYGASKKTYEAFHRGRLKYDKTMENINGFLDHANGDGPHTVGLFVSTDENIHEKGDWLQKWGPKLDELFVWRPHNWINGRKYRVVNREKQTSCGRPRNVGMYIRVDGTVGPCCYDIHGKIQLGDLKTQTIKEVYSGEPYRLLRIAHEANDFTNYVCRDCDQTNFDSSVLEYATNKSRRVGQITSNRQELV